MPHINSSAGSQPEGANTTVFQRPLPPDVRSLIEALDADVPRPTVERPELLASEADRLQLAKQAGQRDIVDKLKHCLERDQEES